MSFWPFHKKRNDEDDNFVIIAQNLAVIYTALESSPFGKGLNNEQLLYGTALIDAYAYLVEKQLSTQELCDCTLSARAGEVSIGFYSVRLFGVADIVSYHDLVCLTLQMIAQIAWVESKAGTFKRPIDYRTCVDMAVSQKDRIASVVREAMEHIHSVSFYANIFTNARHLIDNSDVRDVILAYPDAVPLFSDLEIKETWYTCPACGQLVPSGRDCDCGFKYFMR